MNASASSSVIAKVAWASRCDHPEDHGDVVEAALVVAADVLSHLAEGGEGGADVCDRAERVLPGADIDGGEGPWRPCDRNLNHVPILTLHGFESAGGLLQNT